MTLDRPGFVDPVTEAQACFRLPRPDRRDVA
jgi:hypothetical protein